MRIRRGLATATILVAIGSATTAGAAPAERYAAPGALPPLSASTLGARDSAAHREIARALGTARRARDGSRATALAALLLPGRHYLSFDPRGTGRVVEVFGDLARASRVAVVVPGADGQITNFDSWKFAGGGARAVYERARSLGARDLAAVGWLGYRSPRTLGTGVLTAGRAADGGRELRGFVGELRRVNGAARIGLLCHSYGAVLCGKAAPELPVSDIALFGSPGSAAGSAAALRSPARIWAGRARGDWVRHVPNVRVLGLGFGTDPVSRGFGAVRFAAGSGTHSGYLRPGSAALRALALIALGRGQEVPRA